MHLVSPDMRSRLARRAAALVVAIAAALGMAAASAGAATVVTLPGAPLSVSVGAVGQCQSSYAGIGNNFFPAEGAIGDCGFFLGFPETGNPASVQKRVFGFEGVKGPGLTAQYTPVSQGTPSGSGTASNPYQLITTFKVSDPSKTQEGDYALVEEVTSYVNGQPEFTSTFNVENITGQPLSQQLSPAPAMPLRFHAIYAGNLLTGNSDFGAGLLIAGPPRFVGDQNETTGVLGGFREAASPSPPWSNYEAGCWNVVPEPEGRCSVTSPADGGIWAAVRHATSESPVFNDDVDPNLIDNGAGVSWDDHLGTPLNPGERATYSIVNRAQIANGLSIQPAAQTHTVGQSATVLVTAADSTGAPYANRPIVYSIGPTNPKLGSVLTNAAGMATIGYVGTAAGTDTMQTYLDLAGTGTLAPRDPTATASIVWTSAAPTPSSRYRVRSVQVSAGGVVTIVIVPLQAGSAVVRVTVPTAAISRAAASVAKRSRCKRDQVRIRGRCRPSTTVSGSASASAPAGIAVKITVTPSSSVKRALARGRSVALTTRLTYRSKLGGGATVQTFYLKAKGKAKRKRRHASKRR